MFEFYSKYFTFDFYYFISNVRHFNECEKTKLIETNLKMILFFSSNNLSLDYIRTYTLDKKIESLVKSNLMGKQDLPTIVSPKLYRERFTKAMNRYFLAVPDRWEGLRIE